jgi:hypothetical protein
MYKSVSVVCRLKVRTILEALMLRCDVFVYNFKHVQLHHCLKYNIQYDKTEVYWYSNGSPPKPDLSVRPLQAITLPSCFNIINLMVPYFHWRSLFKPPRYTPFYCVHSHMHTCVCVCVCVCVCEVKISRRHKTMDTVPFLFPWIARLWSCLQKHAADGMMKRTAVFWPDILTVKNQVFALLCFSSIVTDS